MWKGKCKRPPLLTLKSVIEIFFWQESADWCFFSFSRCKGPLSAKRYILTIGTLLSMGYLPITWLYVIIVRGVCLVVFFNLGSSFFLVVISSLVPTHNLTYIQFTFLTFYTTLSQELHVWVWFPGWRDTMSCKSQDPPQLYSTLYLIQLFLFNLGYVDIDMTRNYIDSIYIQLCYGSQV